MSAKSPANLDLKTLGLRILEARHRRADYLPDTIFDEIAWEILLLLYARPEAVCADAVASSDRAYPPSVNARWINYLVSAGLIVRSTGCADVEAPLALTDEGAFRIESCLSEFAQLLVGQG